MVLEPEVITVPATWPNHTCMSAAVEEKPDPVIIIESTGYVEFTETELITGADWPKQATTPKNPSKIPNLFILNLYVLLRHG